MGPTQLHTTAILLFARSSEEDVHHKKMLKSRSLFKVLTAHATNTAKKTGLPLFHISDNEQIGQSFGERFANAIQFVFDQGFENIITIGNDSPHLNAEHINKTIAHLNAGKSSIGPAADGGFYLMGLHRSDFDKDNFEGLSWQTSLVKNEILAILEVEGKEVVLLSTLLDIDTQWDLEIIGKRIVGLSRKILNAIRSVLRTSQKITHPLPFYFTVFHSSIQYNKGSPTPFIS